MQKENLDDTEILNKINGSIFQMDELRLNELNSLKKVQESKNEICKKEAERLRGKYGTDHPMYLKIKHRMEYFQEMFVALDKEIEKSSIKAEEFIKNSWMVHGRVYDKENKSIKSQTVFVSDSNGKWIEAFGSSCSTETGYYSLTMEEKLFENIDRGQQIFLTVSDKNYNLIFISKEALIPSKGIITYRDIFLGDDDCFPPNARNTDGPGKINKGKK